MTSKNRKKNKKPRRASENARKAAAGHAKKPVPRKKLASNKKLAPKTGRARAFPMPEQQRAEIERERQNRIEAHQRAISTRLGGRAKQARIALLGGGPLNIFAEGDSWFDYPFARDIIEYLRAKGSPRPEILNLAHHGDAATEILGISQRQRIEENLTNPNNGKFEALLFSGGGNDIAGDQFVLWLKSRIDGAVAPGDAIDRQRLADIVGVISGAYQDLIAIRDTHVPTCVLFFHSYDFAQPSGKGVCGLGPWLKPSLDFRGWANFAEATEIVKEILKSLDQMLKDFEQQHPNVVYVRTQGVVDPNSDWQNELHPNRNGFNKIGAVFQAALQAKFPGRI
jgi:hypothetical protein